MSLEGINTEDNQSINPAAVAVGFFAGMSSIAVLPAAIAPAAGAAFAAVTTGMHAPGDLTFIAIPNSILGGIVGTLLGPLTTSVAVGYAAYKVTDSVMECVWPKQPILNQYNQNKKFTSDRSNNTITNPDAKKRLKF